MKPILKDPNEVERLTPRIIERRLTPETIIQISDEIKAFASKKTKVNWLNYVMNTLVWTYLRKRVKFNKETLYWIMANFDQLKPIMPTPFWVEVVEVIDKLGEQLYKGVKK